MTVIVLTACPTGLRGHLTKWLLEISAGVFVGTVTSRVRDRLWAQVIQMCGDGRALMVFSVDGEQKLSFKVYNHHWHPADHDGITLIRRPAKPSDAAATPTGPTGWSKAGRRKKFARRNQPGRKHGSAPSTDTNQSE